ncbi:MAG TPA: hypothetical protein VGV10_02675 [Thermoleophilaceae bacterium]|nr:hypothetical protein [Thermoleophilaceae bacterium]
MEYALALIVLLCLVGLVVLHPLLGEAPRSSADEGAREELEAAKEAKYREIRDAELDVQMGKLSKEDHRSIDRELRAEAIEILERLDRLDGTAPDS